MRYIFDVGLCTAAEREEEAELHVGLERVLRIGAEACLLRKQRLSIRKL